ncbi:hypothetical protein OWV82_014602 [Melia azedarach]|uniref:Uncharacterized protein n=1 Tax=Melia azedarach TaxID=155640 RepID=A0ACC1XLK3_MELAZ|nr:hypothetical protein OWV82_014602 [Melia azedarach]
MKRTHVSGSDAADCKWRKKMALRMMTTVFLRRTDIKLTENEAIPPLKFGNYSQLHCSNTTPLKFDNHVESCYLRASAELE